MGDVVKVFFRFRWGAPVTVGSGTGPGTKILGPADALTYLLSWPHKKGVLYDAAVLMCREAMKGRAPLRRSREVFVATAMEARILNCLREFERMGV